MHRESGFTLIELVTVMVLLGILAVYAVPRLAGVNEFSERGYFDELKQAIRYAQKSAIATGCPVTFTIAADGSYSAAWPANTACNGFTSPGVDTPVPGLNSAALAGAPNGVAVMGGNVDLEFNTRGETTAGAGTVITIGGRAFTVSSSGYVQ